MTDKHNFPYSVLMPVYHGDNPDYLTVAVDSMLAQTLKPEEIFIAVDGPIGEELSGIIEGYRRKYGGLFTVKYYPESRGIALTLKDSLPLCRNEFIARMDADDYSAPERVEKQAEVFEKNPSFSIVGCNVDEFTDDITKPVSHVVLPETTEEIFKFARRRTPMRHPAMLYKKSEVMTAYNYHNVYKYEDYDIVVRILRNMLNGGGAYNLQEVLVYMRVSKDFYRRRGGMRLALSSLKMKAGFLRSGFISLPDFVISGFGQAIVTLMPGAMREWFYKKFLRR